MKKKLNNNIVKDIGVILLEDMFGFLGFIFGILGFVKANQIEKELKNLKEKIKNKQK
ncbi:hypothetical protein [Apilactobacillus timberlakei]|uniref:hypothetical protein n=1 Tax=Apilactobacillus timberlakei TaxID=2008380 RepID=UPI0015E832A8|nr:hypothetical protein [Apilactobacillus timberlakei]